MAALRVKACHENGTATLTVLKEHCSGSCHSCGGCGPEWSELKAKNPVGAKPGDAVTVRACTGAVLLAGALQYLIPAAAFVGCYLLGERTWEKGPLLGILGLAAGFVLARVIHRLFVKKKVLYTIIGFDEEAGMRG